MNIRPYREWTPQIGRGAWIDPAATVIGRVTIGEDASVWPGAVVRGDVNAISIGARTSIQDGSVLHVASSRLAGGDGIPLIVGEECTVGHAVILHACTVGRRCLIGMGAIVMDGAVIGDEVIVGTSAPARQVRSLTPEEFAHLAESAAHYVNLKNDYLK